ncbi:MAG: hypothetical protein IKM10_07770 [Bacteroidaceae bacterium]|nr:hypothetical protein [Bacteroidaceae bacterium]
MEERQIALAPKLYKELLTVVYNHNLPINIQVQKNEGRLKMLTLSYDERDEKLIDWIIERVENIDYL